MCFSVILNSNLDQSRIYTMMLHMRNPIIPSMKNLINRILVTVVLLSCGNTCFGGASDIQYPNGIAAVVDTRVITMEDLHYKLSPFVRQLQKECTSAAQFQEKLNPLAQEVLDKMIDDILLVNSFNSDKKMRIPHSFLENHYTKFLVEHFQGNRSNYLEYLEAEGKTDRDVREQQKEEVIIGFLRSRMRRSEATISPEKIQKYYEDNYLKYVQKESVHLRQIILHNNKSESEDSDALPDKTTQVMALLKEGKPFTEVAKEFSEDEMKKSGGDLGWVNRSDIRQELAEVAFSLNKNQFSTPIILNKHTFILYIEDKKMGGVLPLQEVSEDIEKTLANEYAKQSEAQFVQKLRKKAYIKYYL